MKIKYLFTLFICFNCCSTLLIAQEEDNSNNQSVFFGGINMGGYFANKNTAQIYSGTNSITPYGIAYILGIPNYKARFDAYFKYPYAIAEYPANPTYKVAFNFGLHAGINLKGGNAIFVDINSANINYEQFFTMAIDDPNNLSPTPTYEQIPIIGKEKRFNLNLGMQLSISRTEKTNFYWSFFGNLNSIKLLRNYIVINNQQYEIIHTNPQLPSVQPGGLGYGGGTGLGVKYNLSERIIADLTYNFYYTKTKMNDNIQGFGINQGILFRIIWH